MKLWFVCIPLIVLTTSVRVSAADDRPNFLMILLDDAGWTDFGCFGSRIQTPNIDQLASEGMRFTDCHSPAPNCSPSRAGLLTGRIPARAGIWSYRPDGHVMHLQDDEITVAEILQDHGYRTGHFGKWHLSQLLSEQPQPADQGFDHSLGTGNNASPSHLNPVNFVRNGEPVGETDGYSCQLVVEETIEWLSQPAAAEQPFFAAVWFHEPHTPIAAPPPLVSKYQQLDPTLTKKQAAYHACIENVDLAVGRLLQSLDTLNLSQNTLVFLTSDNGPLNAFSSKDLRGKKSHVWEGGHRVPGIFRWPGRIAANSTCDVPISGIDYLPTVCAVAGLPVPPDRHIDGTSILPLLRNQPEQFQRPQPLYWFFYRLNPGLALRDGDWCLIATTSDEARPKTHALTGDDLPHIRSSVPVDFQLYNLASDPGQQHNVLDRHPAVAARLTDQLRRIHQGVIQEATFWEIPADYGTGKQRKVWNSD